MTRLMEIDEELVDALIQGSDAESAEAAVHSALRKHLLLQKQGALRALFGTVEFDPDYDYKAMRVNRFADVQD